MTMMLLLRLEVMLRMLLSLLDKMLFLHRSSVEMEKEFSVDEEPEEETSGYG